MFRVFENLIDPYQDYTADQAPPRALGAFLWSYLRPLRGVFVWAAVSSLIVAAIEIALIAYLGRLVAIMEGADRTVFWGTYGPELIMVTVAILLLRPVLQGVDTLLMNQTLMPNVGTLARYRAHAHVLRQSVGWFENDFAGRIANRIMQTPPAMGEVVFQVFDALTFSLAYLIGALIMLAEADGRLTIPLILWSAFFLALVVWTVRRIGPASEASSDARSAVTGRVVDSYTNIHSVKLFAHHDGELHYAVDAIEHARKTFQREMRLYTIMDLGLVTLNGALVVGVVGWALYLWVMADASLGIVAAAAALVLRLNGMAGWIMWATTSFFRELGVVAEGMRTIADPIDLQDAPNAKALQYHAGDIALQNVTHHYGRKTGGLNDISLHIPAGQKIGIVGRSGAGKSTLIKMILRFHDPEQGQVLIDGQDVKQVTQSSLRRQLGVVQQDSSLLHRSIRDNIMFGRPDADDDQMIAAA
ncbi:MAG: ABC transporter ATP-binding protein, partial [Pseudomonadota bacterium]